MKFSFQSCCIPPPFIWPQSSFGHVDDENDGEEVLEESDVMPRPDLTCIPFSDLCGIFSFCSVILIVSFFLSHLAWRKQPGRSDSRRSVLLRPRSGRSRLRLFQPARRWSDGRYALRQARRQTRIKVCTHTTRWKTLIFLSFTWNN